MDIIFFNINWMLINIALAAIAVIFGWLTLFTHSKIFKVLFIVLWLFFVPNTLYILTDIIHIPTHWLQAVGFWKIVLIFEYLILELAGFASFILAVYPIEKAFFSTRLIKRKILADFIIVLLIFLIGFGIVLGRIQRLNSWEIFTNTERVVSDSLSVLSSPQLTLLAIILGLIGNLVYYTFIYELIAHLKKYFPKIPV